MRMLSVFLLLIIIFPNRVLGQECGLYQYAARIVKVYDGDTVTADVDLGFNTWRLNEKLRLYGIDAPEIRGKEKARGLLSRDALRNLIDGKKVILCSIKDKKGKYGRYLVRIFINGKEVNNWLVAKGFAVQRNY